MKEEEPDEVGDNVVGEDQGFSEEDESRINEATEGVNDGGGGGVNAPVCQAEVHELQARPQGPQQEHQHQQPQQQVLPPPPPPPPPCPVVQWERFLPVRSLKVLLVENDDSTRQVVSALLRNCSYEVTAVSNGLEAWKILEDLTNHIDIVLTEVVMPCLSGVGLLGKIICHKTCKNIPVIMMSSHDSMGLVFKCLSKGAVDFLVKPIRKNELKNLWQHIWRRCHSSSGSGSGSGSESGTQTQKSVKSKNTNDSDNSTGSNNKDDNSSIGLNTRDGSDNGSGTQNSWTKLAAEPDSPQPSSPWNQLAEAPDNTCAQVIHPKLQTFCNHWVPKTCSECREQKEQLHGNPMAKDLEIGVSRNPDVQQESYPSGKVSMSMTSAMADNTKKNGYRSDDVFRRLDVSNATCELTIQAADLLGTIAKSSMVTTSAQASNSCHKITGDKDKASGRSNELPSLELSLKRLRSIGGGGITSNDDRYVLRCSDHSAFSRYNTFVTSSQKRKVYGGSCSVPLNNGSEAEKLESKQNATPLNKGSNSICNINDVSSTTNYSFNKPTTINEKVSSSPTTNALKTTLAFNPMKQQNCATQSVMLQSIDNMASTNIVEDQKGAHHVQVQHHHHHYHHHHHHVHVAEQQLQQLQPPSDHDELSPKDMAAAVPPCGSSSMFSGPIEAKVGNYSLNGSVSGSNHGSNGTMNPGGTNMESDNRLVGKDKAGGYNSSGKGGGGGVDQNQFEQRVAALTKFRQKKKTEMLPKEGSLPKQEETSRAAATCSWAIC